MKKISTILILITAVINTYAQDITFDVKTYQSSSNISCHGLSDGAISATAVNGVAPYSYSWSNGATTQNITGVPAGVYTLTVTDADNHTATKTVTLYEPDALTLSPLPSQYGTLLANKPEEAVRGAIRGMLPHNRLGRQQLTKLKVYAGPVHPHVAQNPETIEFTHAKAR